jgi:hypothetical protein
MIRTGMLDGSIWIWEGDEVQDRKSRATSIKSLKTLTLNGLKNYETVWDHPWSPDFKNLQTLSPETYQYLKFKYEKKQEKEVVRKITGLCYPRS